MNPASKHISKNGVLGLLDELEAEGCASTVYIAAETLTSGDCGHLLPESDPWRSRAAQAVSSVGPGDTGLVAFLAPARIVIIQPPVPLTVDARRAGMAAAPLRDLLASEPVIGVVLLRLRRYAVGVLCGERLLATKTDSRYMKSRHRAGGQSQRRFERSRERLIRELFDKACEVTRNVFGPHLGIMDYVQLGGERGTLNGFVKRCRFIREMGPKTLSRRIPVDRPDQRALERIPHEVWKSRVTFFDHG